jgi:hypothetical protein
MEVSIDTRELVALERRLALAGKATPKNIRTMLKKIGVIVQGKAVAFAPRSMTKSEYIRTLKTGKTKRSVFTSGSLKSSITTEVKKDSVEIGVPSNSKAGDYAEKVHQDWKRTQHNPPPATDHFIFKAQEKSEKTYMRAVDDFVDKIIKAI